MQRVWRSISRANAAGEVRRFADDNTVPISPKSVNVGYASRALNGASARRRGARGCACMTLQGCISGPPSRRDGEASSARFQITR